MVHGHHIAPRVLGGTDDYQNIVIVHEWIHKLIHAKTSKLLKNILTYFS
ncbi:MULTISPECIES: HNH endonuclease [Enterococcus]|nr:HNH endonuclease [Enterococcus faecalis]HBI1562930.1 HNH endonuclease [Enterococcus faecalis]HBI1566048.1 HNH endonuclease [Enterococcus faecalis]HBI1718473.1 HNH endonuclease [Enterococcus faecalis]HBI1721451.1 HNH endonuclease [Enterococcus faecalis]